MSGNPQKMRPLSGPTRFALVDLFSGCGGTSAGFLATRVYEHLYAADIDPFANATYTRNLGHRPVAQDLGELVRTGGARRWATNLRGSTDKPIVLIGCAPCQGFSSHVKVIGDKHGRNLLLDALTALIVELAPESVFIENVPDLFARRNWHSFCRLREGLEAAGYGVAARIINAAELGVPQERFRGIILARKGAMPTFPEPRFTSAGKYSTVREWIGRLPPVSSGETHPLDSMHQASNHRQETLRIIRYVPVDGGNRPVGVGPRCLDETRILHGGYTDVYGRLPWDAAAPTITARCRTPSCGRFVHPEQDRGLTAREAALLQTFPPQWQFEGPFDDRYKQIGNAVPPLAAYAFARHIALGWPRPRKELGCMVIGDLPVGESFSVLIPGIRRRRDRRVA